MTIAEINSSDDGSMDDPLEQATRPSPPYRLYALIICLFFVIRYADLVTQNMDWTVWVYNSRLCRVGLAFAAVVGSCLTGLYLKHRVPSLMAWMLCGLVGGAITLFTNSFVGMIIGFSVGGFVVFGKTTAAASTGKRLFGTVVPDLVGRMIPVLARTILPSVLVGLATGGVVLLAFVNYGQVSRSAEMTTALGPLVFGVAVFVFVLRRTSTTRRWYGWIGAMCVFLTCALVGFICVSALDSHRRCAAMVNVRSESYGIPVLQNLGATRFRRFVAELANECLRSLRVDALFFGPHSTDTDIAYARGLPAVMYLTFDRGCPLGDASLKSLSTRYLTSFSCYSGTNVTDKGVQRLEKRGLCVLELEGPNFTDASLQGITNVPNLQYLRLPGTNVTSAGLRKLDTRAPLFYMELNNTQVDDEVFVVAGKLPMLRYLLLRGTNITGRGLKQLRGMPLNLDLGETAFEERYLADLLPEKLTDPYGVPLPMLESLCLREIPLSPATFKTIARFTSLTSLDVTGSDLSYESLQLIGSLPNLNMLGIDGDQLSPENMKLLRSRPDLHLSYDAAETSFEEIFKHIETLESSPYSTIGPRIAGRLPDAQLIIRNLEIDEEIVRELRNKVNSRNGHGVSFERAVKPDGTVKDYSDIWELRADFPGASQSPQ